MIINQSQPEPQEKLLEPQPQPLLLPKQLKRRINQIKEQQSPFPNIIPEWLLEHPQSLLPQPVAAKSLIVSLHDLKNTLMYIMWIGLSGCFFSYKIYMSVFRGGNKYADGRSCASDYCRICYRR